jgi:hypothetical protein
MNSERGGAGEVAPVPGILAHISVPASLSIADREWLLESKSSVCMVFGHAKPARLISDIYSPSSDEERPRRCVWCFSADLLFTLLC